MSYVKNVGEKIRKVRESKNLSQDQLAEKSKLSKQLISEIESRKEMPFLAPLIRISRSLGVRLSTFLDESGESGPVISRAASNKPSKESFNVKSAIPCDLEFFPLASDKAGRHMEPFIIDVKPCKDNEFILSSHEGEEFLYVLSGDIEITYGTEVFKLSCGESIYYDSIVNHHLHSASDKPARVLAVVYSPY